MRALLVVAVVAMLAVVVGIGWGWRFVIAPLLGGLVWAWGTATLRSFRRGAHGVAVDDDAPPITPGRTLYWCEECSAEMVVTFVGSGVPPRHCGARMHRRTEVSN